MNYKKTLIAFLLITLVFPSLVVAKSENASENKGNGFCERISGLSEGINKKMGISRNNLYRKRFQIKDQVQEQREQNLENKEQRREKWDTNREEHFSKLKERAQTEGQKQAVLNFIKVIQGAISARREMVDLAIEEYHQELNNLKDSRAKSLNSLIENYKADIELIFKGAQTECDNGSDQITINNNIKNELKALKDAFMSDKKELSGVKGQIREIVSKKKKTIEIAISEFKMTADIALSDLKKMIK